MGQTVHIYVTLDKVGPEGRKTLCFFAQRTPADDTFKSFTFGHAHVIPLQLETILNFLTKLGFTYEARGSVLVRGTRRKLWRIS